VLKKLKLICQKGDLNVDKETLDKLRDHLDIYRVIELGKKSNVSLKYRDKSIYNRRNKRVHPEKKD
jgi:hypothetical protein